MAKHRHRIPAMLIAGVSNIESWMHSFRTLIMVASILLICFTDVSRDISAIRMASGGSEKLNAFEILFLQSYRGFNLQLSSMTFLVMMSFFPARTSYQEFCLIRCNKKTWLHGQIFYAFIISALYILCLIIFTFAISLFKCSVDNNWSTFFTQGIFV